MRAAKKLQDVDPTLMTREQVEAARARLDDLRHRLSCTRFLQHGFNNAPSEEEWMAECEAEFAKIERGEHADNVVLLPLGAALRYAKRYGWKIFPADVAAKKSYLAAAHAPDGLNWGMTSDLQQLRKNFSDAKWRSRCGIGIPTGEVNDIFVVEADTTAGHKVDGLASIKTLEGKHGELPATLMAQSPIGSVHRFFKHPSNGRKVKNSASEIAPGVDVRGDGGMVIAPPSRRKDGHYQWLNDLPIADPPEWLLQSVCDERDRPDNAGTNAEKNAFERLGQEQTTSREKAWATTALSGLAEEPRNTSKGERNQKLYKCAFRMGTMIARDWITRETVEQELEKAADDCQLVKDDSRHSVRATIKSGIDGGLQTPHEDLKDNKQPKADDNVNTNLMQSSAEFVANFMPPEYLIDGLLQRRYVYSMTAPTGFGKTTIALLIASCVSLGLPLAGREVEKGRVLFFAGENPDDIRTRWIKLCEVMGHDPDTMDVVFMPFTLNLSQAAVREKIDAEAAEHGPFSLLIVDTSAAYYSGSDENDNVQLGNHARMLRTFVDLPGGPTVLVTCHPAKAYDLDNLLPRGGGAFLAEVDGNLVCVKDMRTQVVEVTTHGKFQGPEFSPFAFLLKRLPETRTILVLVFRRFVSPSILGVPVLKRPDGEQEARFLLSRPWPSATDGRDCWWFMRHIVVYITQEVGVLKMFWLRRG